MALKNFAEKKNYQNHVGRNDCDVCIAAAFCIPSTFISPLPV
jgi:hypothetical protein